MLLERSRSSSNRVEGVDGEDERESLDIAEAEWKGVLDGSSAQ